MTTPIESRLVTAARWAERQLSHLVTDDNGDGAFIRGTGTELAGFGARMEEFRAALKEYAQEPQTRRIVMVECRRHGMVSDEHRCEIFDGAFAGPQEWTRQRIEAGLCASEPHITVDDGLWLLEHAAPIIHCDVCELGAAAPPARRSWNGRPVQVLCNACLDNEVIHDPRRVRRKCQPEELLASLNVALWGMKGHTYPDGVVDRVLDWLREQASPSVEDSPTESRDEKIRRLATWDVFETVSALRTKLACIAAAVAPSAPSASAAEEPTK